MPYLCCGTNLYKFLNCNSNIYVTSLVLKMYWVRNMQQCHDRMKQSGCLCKCEGKGCRGIYKVEGSANGEIQPLVTDRAVEFEKYPVQVQDFRQIGDDYKRISRIYLNSIKGNWKVCNQLDWETLRSQPILPKISVETGKGAGNWIRIYSGGPSTGNIFLSHLC